MEKKKFFQKRPLRTRRFPWSLLFFVLAVISAIGFFLSWNGFFLHERYFSAQVSSPDQPLVPLPRFKKLDFEDLPLSDFPNASFQDTSFSGKLEVASVSGTVTEQDISNGEMALLKQTLFNTVEKSSSATLVTGYLEDSVVIQLKTSTVPAGTKAEKFDVGIQGNVTIVAVPWEEVLGYLGKHYSISRDDILAGNFRRETTFTIRKVRNETLGHLTINFYLPFSSEVLIPEK